MARKSNLLLYAGIAVAVGLGIAYYKKWPPLMKFIHAPKVAPKPVAQPQMPQQQPQQGVHPMGATPGAVMPQQQMIGGFGGGMIPQMQQPMMMPQTMPIIPQYQPTMMPQVGAMMPPTLMPGMTYGGVV